KSALRKTIEQLNQEKYPQELGDVGTIDKASVTSNALRYNVTLNQNSQWPILTNATIKSKTLPYVCSNSIAKDLLNGGMNIEYSFSVVDSAQTFFITINKDDCMSSGAR